MKKAEIKCEAPAIIDWSEQRQRAFKRDGFKCQRCGCGSIESLRAHHLNYWAEKGTEDELRSLVTLCDYCHDKFHSKRTYDEDKKCHVKK